MTYQETLEARNHALAERNRKFREFEESRKAREAQSKAAEARRESERRKQNFQRALNYGVLPVVKRRAPTLTHEELQDAF